MLGRSDIGKCTLLVITTSSRLASSRSQWPVTFSLAPSEYMSAHVEEIDSGFERLDEEGS